MRDPEPAAAAVAGRRDGGGAARQLLTRPMRELMREAEERLLQRTLRLSADEAASAARAQATGKVLNPTSCTLALEAG